MTTMARIGVGIGAVAIIIGLVAGAHAQNTTGTQDPFMGRGGRGGFGPSGGRDGVLGLLEPLGPMAQRLNLSDAQKDRLKSIKASHQADRKALDAQALAAHQALEAAVAADTFDETTIRSRASDVAAVEGDLAVTRARIRAEVLQVLTPEQQAQLKRIQTQMQQRAESRRQGTE
jgi:protein CpxP